MGEDGEESVAFGRTLTQSSSSSSTLHRILKEHIRRTFKSGEVRRLKQQEVLKAYRLIGGAGGVTEVHLRQALCKLRNTQLRKQVEDQLQQQFAQHDTDGNGFLNLKEFELLVHDSTLLTVAIFELMEQAAGDDLMKNHSQLPGESIVEKVVIVVVVFNAVQLALSTDFPYWRYWLFIEMSFLAFFVMELLIRLDFSSRRHLGLPKPGFASRCAFLMHGLPHFMCEPGNMFDVAITLMAAASCWFEFAGGNFTILRFFRLARLGRITKLMRGDWFYEFRHMCAGVTRCLQIIIPSLLFIGLVVFALTVILRQNLMSLGDTLVDEFPNVPASMLIIYRCLALGTEGACLDSDGMPFFKSIQAEMDWPAAMFWVVSESVVSFGILNMISSVFLVQALAIDRKEKEVVELQSRPRELELLAKLDKLLRTLTHPQRQEMKPNERKAANVTSFIQKKHPEVLQHFQDFNQAILQFAEDIQSSKEQYQNAMDKYELKETNFCKELRILQSAELYYVGSEEKLLTDQETILGACKVELLQETTNLTELLEEAKEVQLLIKSQILPGTAWARTPSPGSYSSSCGKLWKESHHMCDEVIDPGTKHPERSKEKVEKKYGGNYSRNRDYSRLGLVYYSVEHLMTALRKFLKFRMKAHGCQVVKLENRFAEPTPLGWRDISLLIRVRVPSSGHRHLMEVQMQLHSLLYVRNVAHDFYATIRGLLPDDALTVIIDQLTVDSTLDLGLTNAEWHHCLQNKEVAKILDELKVPETIRRDIVDVLDADGSGVVSSAELRVGLPKCRGHTLARDVMCCKLKLEHMQQYLQTQLESLTCFMHDMLNANRKDLVGHTRRMLNDFAQEHKLLPNCLKLDCGASARPLSVPGPKPGVGPGSMLPRKCGSHESLAELSSGTFEKPLRLGAMSRQMGSKNF